MIMNNLHESLHQNPRERQIEILENDFKKSLKPYVKEAYKFIIGKESSIEEKDDVVSIIERIKELAYCLTLYKGSIDNISNFSETFIVSNESIKKILPIIRKLRKEIFSKEDPLFPDDPYRATEWLKNKAKKEAIPYKQDIDNNQKQISETVRHIEKKICELSTLMNRNFSLKPEEDNLLPIPLVTKGRLSSSSNYLFVWPRSPLARLERETKKLSEETNFSQVSLIMFVLTGIRPISLKYNFISEIKFGDLGIKKRVNMIIYRPLNKGELEKIFYKIKKAFGRKGKQFINEKHVELYNLIEKHGGVPETKKTEFWKKILKEWNMAHSESEDKYKYPNCPRIAYLRAKRYIQEQITKDDFK